jgi:hypothetical protein
VFFLVASKEAATSLENLNNGRRLIQVLPAPIPSSSSVIPPELAKAFEETKSIGVARQYIEEAPKVCDFPPVVYPFIRFLRNRLRSLPTSSTRASRSCVAWSTPSQKQNIVKRQQLVKQTKQSRPHLLSD